MWRDLALPSWVLSLWLASTPTMAAGADGTLGRDADGQWSSGITKVPTPVRRGAPARKPTLVAQAQTQTPPGTETPAAPTDGANPAPGVAEDALKAEMEKRYGDAERLYRELLAKDPGRVDLSLRLVDILAAEGKKLEAAQTLAQVADRRSEDADLQLRASQAFGAADRPADALRYVDRALAVRPTDQALQRQRAQVATWAGDYAQAVESLRALVAADPADLKSKRDLAQVLGWQGHWDEAAKIVSEYVAEHPADKGALLDLARIQSAGGDMDAAQQSLQRYRDAGGDDETYKRELAKVLSDTNAPIKAEMEKRYGDAERMYREMLAREPDRADLSLRLVDVLAAENKQAEAAAILAKVADAKADDADLQARASEAAAGADRLADALRYIDRAIALRPTDLTLQQRRAQLATWAGKYAEAEKSLKTLVEANPTDVTLKRDLGRVLMWQHQLPEAAGLLGQFLAEHPDDKQVLLDLSQIETERKNFKAAADLLRRYREAGGDEETYRHELARGITPPRGPASAGGRAGAGGATRASGAGAAAPAAGIPPDVIKAESAKRWSEAERLLRGHLARDPRRVELWLRLVQVLAAQKKTLAAAQAMAQAADLKPSDADLQLHTSEAFGAANRPAEALRYVDRALAVHPNDLALHKRRVQLANWGSNYPEAEESLRVLIAADPSDLTLMRDLGKVLGWEGRSDEAAAILWGYVEQVPTDKEGLLALARIQAGRGGSQSAAELLDRYRAAGGDELTYQHEMALDLAWGGRLRSALVIADAGLARDPTDFPFHYARAVALLNGYEYGPATDELNRLTQLRPNASELGGLHRSIEVPQRPYLQIDSSGYRESDHITTQTNLISYHQPINDAWWLFAGGTTDYLDARTGTGFAPIQGGHFMARGAGYVGAQALLDLATVASAQVGATGSGRDTRTTWLLTASSQLSDDLRLQLYNGRDFQIVSPRSLSLGITRIDTDVTATFTPDMLWTVVTTAHEAELSDSNRYLRGVIAPRRGILRTQYWNVDLGISGDWSGYSLKPNNGYYSPSFYQKYLASTYVYYKMSDESGISLIASLGAQRDETFQNFKLATGVYTEATFGLLSDWMWKIRGGYSNNGSAAGPGFSSETVGVTLVKRF
jgi:predicted Zn-dependent protease